MVQIEGDVREKVKSLLKELFQFDSQDLDFGIYRIMNFKRKEIEKFIEEDLIKAAEEEFKEYAKVGVANLQKEVERLINEINRDFGAGTIDNQGRVHRLGDAPKIQQYISKLEEIDSAQLTQAQVNDVFNHVYEFFSRYYDKGDFLSKRRYGGREKYFIPYNGEETLLHWATTDQYYVKTGEYFKRYSFRAGAYRVNFVLMEADVDPNDVKNGNRYFLLHKEDIFKLDEANRTLDVHFNYRELTEDEEKRCVRGHIQDRITSEILDELFSKIGNKEVAGELQKKTGGEEVTSLERHISRYVTRNTTDYFIHKNLKAFLERELEFYLKTEVLDIEEIRRMNERDIHLSNAKLKAILGIGKKITEFLAQIEDFQKMLWEKKKFVLQTDYCMTLDMVPEKFYKEIGTNERQVADWKETFKLDETTKDTLDSTKGKEILNENFLKSHKSLVLDTKFFNQEFRDELLASFENLEEKIDGLIIKSENWQALNLLQKRYEGKVKCIYIDPPYNTGDSEILYKNSYQSSSWLSLVENPLRLAFGMLTSDPVVFIAIDDFEMVDLSKMVDTLFPHFKREMIVVNHHPQGGKAKTLANTHEYMVVLVARDSDVTLTGRLSEEGVEYRPFKRSGTAESNFRYGRPNSFYAILVDQKTGKVVGIERPPKANETYAVGDTKEGFLRIYPLGRRGEERVWRRSYESCLELVNNGKLHCSDNRTIYQLIEAHERTPALFSNWIGERYNAGTYGANLLRDILGMQNPFSYPKSIHTVEDAIFSIGAEDSIICLDFFAGSGTTAHAVLNLNAEDCCSRKYILVEMAEYVDTVLKPRIQKILYSKEWKDGLPISKEGMSHMFKYIYLEQYEDALNNIVFREKDKTIQETLGNFQDYFIRYMLDYETRDSPARLTAQKFQTPFDYKIKTINGTEEKEQNVDLVETFNYLLGLTVSKVCTFKEDQRKYHVVYGKRNNDSTVIIWRNTKDIDLQRDKKFIEEKVLSGNSYDLIFVNGDSYVKNATAIEPEFKKLAGA